MKTKINQSKIYFFEVEKADRILVKKKYPKAKIFTQPYSIKLAKKCEDAEVMVGMVHSDFSGKALSALPHLKLIVTRTAGYDHIDLKWADESGIPVCFVPDYGSHVIAEHVFALLLSSIRNVLEGEERTAHNKFYWEGLRGVALKGKTLGVIGTGRIGAHVCRIASEGFLMNVIGYDCYKNKDLKKLKNFKYAKNIDEIWKKADVITLHTPLLPSTQHLINAKTIAKMKDKVILINTARGGLIDTPALVKAIKKGKFTRVALDVIEHENNIKEDVTLLHLPHVIITPHIAFYTKESVEKMYSEAFVSIDEYNLGKKLCHQVCGH
jgi:D-lactate dehydrogenase